MNTRRDIYLECKDETDNLIIHHQKAFSLLTGIAMEFSRIPKNSKKLEIEESSIINFKKYGLKSSREYKGAKKTLVKLGYIEIKTYVDKDLTQKQKIKLTDSKIWWIQGINYEELPNE
jgi:hypothetical protein